MATGCRRSAPFDSGSFDRVLSQFGLMFFQDRVKSVSEMARVLKPGSEACVAVWASLSDTPGYAVVAKMLLDLFGPKVARSIEAPQRLSRFVQPDGTARFDAPVHLVSFSA